MKSYRANRNHMSTYKLMLNRTNPYIEVWSYIARYKSYVDI